MSIMQHFVFLVLLSSSAVSLLEGDNRNADSDTLGYRSFASWALRVFQQADHSFIMQSNDADDPATNITKIVCSTSCAPCSEFERQTFTCATDLLYSCETISTSTTEPCPLPGTYSFAGGVRPMVSLPFRLLSATACQLQNAIQWVSTII